MSRLFTAPCLIRLALAGLFALHVACGSSSPAAQTEGPGAGKQVSAPADAEAPPIPPGEVSPNPGPGASEADNGDDSEPRPRATPSVPRRDPRGPDELFAPLSDVGLHEGVPPRQFYKVLILRVPNHNSNHDDPAEDLHRRLRYASSAFYLLVEQELDYRPQFHREFNDRRRIRYEARLRPSDVPRAGDEVEMGARFDAYEEACRVFVADYVLAYSFIPGETSASATGAAWRYRRGRGIEHAEQFAVTHPGADGADAMLVAMEGVVARLLDGAGLQPREDGEESEPQIHASVPRLAQSDLALRDFAALRDNLLRGEMTNAWIAYEELIAREPENGRAALYAMEVFRGLSTGDTSGQGEAFRERVIRLGREALRHVPNDAMLRGRLAMNAWDIFNRRDWAMEAFRQGLHMQPLSMDLLGWYMTVKYWWLLDRDEQAHWLLEYVNGRITDGRIELYLGDMYFGGGNFAKGIEWYLKAAAIAPANFEVQSGLGLCANYETERLTRESLRGIAGSPETRERRAEIYGISVDALWAAIELDPFHMDLAHQFYPRAVTQNFRFLPSSPAELDRLFLMQSILFALTETSRTGQFDRLVAPMIASQRRVSRRAARTAKPGQGDFGLQLMARFQFAVTDSDVDDVIRTLRLMHDHGFRPDMYYGGMRTYGARVLALEPDPD
jgi:tetratricopeptide (TPR) repeat protein